MNASQEESDGWWCPRLTPMYLGLVPVCVGVTEYWILHQAEPVVHAEPAVCA
jgi:hypothetical protein